MLAGAVPARRRRALRSPRWPRCDGPVPGDWLQIAVEHDGALVGDVAVGLDADGRDRHDRLHAGAGVTRVTGFGPRGGRRGRRPAVRRARRAPRRGVARPAQHRVGPARRGARVRATRASPGVGGAADGEWVDDARYGLDRRQHAAWRARPRARRPTSASSRSPRRRRGPCWRCDTHRTRSASSPPMRELVRRRPVPRRRRRRAGRAVDAGDRGRRRAGRVRDARRGHRRTTRSRTSGACSSTVATSVAASATASSTLLVERLRGRGPRARCSSSWHRGPGGPEPFYLAPRVRQAAPAPSDDGRGSRAALSDRSAAPPPPDLVHRHAPHGAGRALLAVLRVLGDQRVERVASRSARPSSTSARPRTRTHHSCRPVLVVVVDEHRRRAAWCACRRAGAAARSASACGRRR